MENEIKELAVLYYRKKMIVEHIYNCLANGENDVYEFTEKEKEINLKIMMLQMNVGGLQK